MARISAWVHLGWKLLGTVGRAVAHTLLCVLPTGLFPAAQQAEPFPVEPEMLQEEDECPVDEESRTRTESLWDLDVTLDHYLFYRHHRNLFK